MTVKHIVCAVRGQPQSRATVTRAIGLALKYGARLTFVHVMDAEFLAHATVGIVRLMYQELRSMGEFLMAILRDRAERRGVREVHTVLLEGRAATALPRFLKEQQADLLVLGAPGGSRRQSAFAPGDFNAFVQHIEAQGIQVELVPAE